MQNRLGSETSPYLLQHADNPVHWQPWDETALAEARQTGKPILLSVGYSACHWCHVMAHESFEDKATAQVMNEHFVNIKVDREERPDLDKIYQTAHHLLSGRPGGWPLTVFLDPETHHPFFAGTYFPKSARYQLPGFVDLLLRIRSVFNDKRPDLVEQGEKLQAALVRIGQGPTEGAPESQSALLDACVSQLQDQYDVEEGGFGGAPKFPMPTALARLLNHWAWQARDGRQDRGLLDKVMISLTRMARGGIYDHLGGGFCRYATDRAWMVPHFEKMLYDNGQLLSLYARALTIGPDPLFEDAVRETAGWLLREMRSPDGVFHAALDADSEGEEGRFYVWRRQQIRNLLTEDEYAVVATLYGIDKPANFENKWILHRRDAWRSVVERLSLEPGPAAQLLASARARLFAARSERVRPGLDDKALTAWNALAIKGLAEAARALDEPAWLGAAQTALDFIRANLWRDGVLHASWQGGTARFPAYLDDYANLLDASLTLLQCEWRDEDAAFAQQLANAAIERFEDADAGGFFFTAHDQASLIVRLKPASDEALPAGNGVMAKALAEAGQLFGDARMLTSAARTLEWAMPAMAQYPAGHCSLMEALEYQAYSPDLVILRGTPEAIAEWRQELPDGYQPGLRVYGIPHGSRTAPAYLPALAPLEPHAHVCTGASCSLPVHSPSELRRLLGA